MLTAENKARVSLNFPGHLLFNLFGLLCQEEVKERSHHPGNGNGLWSSVEGRATVTQRGRKNMFASFWSTEMPFGI